MIFENIYEARNWFLKYSPISEEEDDKIPFFWHNLSDHKWEFGDWILIQHIIEKEHGKDREISRPILAIFTNFKIWDQALVINFVQPQRAWMLSHEVITNKELRYSMYISSLDDEVESIQFWTDNINVLGHWKNKPSIGEIKKALNKKI
jgi:hypothetical protein